MRLPMKPAVVVEDNKNFWRKTVTLGNSAEATITDCPFEPDIVFAYMYQNDSNRVIDAGGSAFNKLSAGVSQGTGYSFGNYGITVTGNTISILSGFAINKNKQVEVIAIKNS